MVSLLAGKLDRTGFGATLAGLAVQGWFQVRGPGETATAGAGEAAARRAPPGAPGPAMCVVPAEAPGGSLTPFERRVVAHVALRAGAAGQVPAPALSDGFEGGEAGFMSAFKEEVDAEARRRGLTRPRLSGRRIGLLCLLLAVPAGTLPGAAAALHQRHGLAWAGGLYLAGCVLAIGVRVSRRRSAAGQAVLARWRSAVAAAPGDARLLGYAAALGAAPAALAVFAPGQANTAWSSYRGGWQQLEIETSTWSWPLGCLAAIGIGLGPAAYMADQQRAAAKGLPAPEKRGSRTRRPGWARSRADT